MSVITPWPSSAPVLDQGLSCKALGLLWALSIAQQQGQPLSVALLCRITSDGRDRIVSGLQELERRGLLQRPQQRLSNGRLGPGCWVIDPANRLGLH